MKMIERRAPIVEANRLSAMLNAVLRTDAERFPVNVEALALEYSMQCFPEAPITKIEGAELPGFEGMLAPNSAKTKWRIVYNNHGRSSGRIRFTLAHEFGHYLLHRSQQQEFTCSELDMHDWDSKERALESDADTFASYLLMPLDDFRRQVNDSPISFDVLSHCATRYGVSLTAAALKWIEIAPRRAILVASRDDHLLWARSNAGAFRSGRYFATRKRTIQVPAGSSLHSQYAALPDVHSVPARMWFPAEPIDMLMTEMRFVIDHYDYTLGLLLMPETEWRRPSDEVEDELLVPVDRLLQGK
ncbi:MAG: ImmA/IrrE family metallo-endopeptidase [Pseudomonadota bacterium]|nr:ImmA/IrrE family metallo-endopeptidase [Pseudomonadota bacterium]